MENESRIDNLLSAFGTLEKAEEFTKKHERLDYQMLLAIQGRFEESWEVCRELERDQPDNYRAAFNRGWHILRTDLHKGLGLMEGGRKLCVWGDSDKPDGIFTKTNKRPWDGEADLKGKRVMLWGEGGFGDEIIGARFARAISDMGALPIVACSSGLATLFARSFDGAIIQKEVALGSYFDEWIPSFRAPYSFNLTYETLPGKAYIKPDPLFVKKWSYIIKSNKIKVGIRWRGLMAFEHEQLRRFPFGMFLNSVDQRHVDLFSLQLSDCSDINLMQYPQIKNLEPYLKSWEDTAGAIANLDLVVTSCTSVAHLSAAMGKPTCVIVPILPYYIWAYQGDKSPWYDSVTLFRQEKYNEWGEPFAKLRHHIEDLRNGTEAIGQTHSAQTGDGSPLRKVA